MTDYNTNGLYDEFVSASFPLTSFLNNHLLNSAERTVCNTGGYRSAEFVIPPEKRLFEASIHNLPGYIR